MKNKKIIQLRDDRKSAINADIIDGIIAEDNISVNIILKNSQRMNLELFLNGCRTSFSYTVESELDYKYYCEDADAIRCALNKIGGNI